MDKEQVYEIIDQKEYQPLSYKEMLDNWNIGKREELILKGFLIELTAEGLIYMSKSGKYISINKKGYKIGRIFTNGKGFGFFRDNDSSEEYFIAHKYLNNAQDKDTVLIVPISNKSGKNKEAKVKKIIKRGTKSFIGVALYNKGKLIIRAVDDKIFGDYSFKASDIKKGDKVFVRITGYPEENKPGEVEIIGLTGNMTEIDIAIENIIVKYGLRKEFPIEVLKNGIKEHKEVTEEEIEIDKRRDLRDLLTVTIDGEDARDFDDAITLEKICDVYRLGVHIADVSYYVPENGIIDKEAYKRATSVYFPDRVYPMLPMNLSNNICSLNEGVDRMAMTVMIDIDSKGKILSYEIFPSIIKSNHRMTYTNVDKILRRNENKSLIEGLDIYRDIFNWFDLMSELSKILIKKRYRRGAIFFDFPELKITVDEFGKPIKLDKIVRNQAESIIEEFMLAANEVVAEYLFWLKAPCLYRVHEEPSIEGINNFNSLAALYGFKINLDDNGKVHPREFQNIIDKLENHPMKELLINIILRSMSHARYDIRALGHYGLSVAYYCHFTSPIRRYSDLEVHRLLKKYLTRDVLNDQEKVGLNFKAYKSSVQSSEREMAVENAERDVNKVMVAFYMKNYVGESFRGKVSGMINSGLFIELDNLAEGFLPFASLSGHHVYYEKEMVVRNNSGAIRFKIGDYLNVILVKADVLLGYLDFVLKEEENIDKNSRK